MADRKPRSGPLDKLRAIINEARIACGSPNSCPSISHVMLTPPFLRRIEREGCQIHILALGINSAVRTFLKDGDAEERKGASPGQLDLWPRSHREIVREIDRAAVYVPSRKEFVPLEPSDISPAETNEAGLYLVSFGDDCIRAGRNLIRLARLRW